MLKQFWVIGAQYGDLEFSRPLDGTLSVAGPFPSYQEARHAWRERSLASRHEACTRFTIVTNPAG